jgi:hypothetical protein
MAHELQLDGVDTSHVNFDFDWSRHLPSEVPLTRGEHDKQVLTSRVMVFFGLTTTLDQGSGSSLQVLHLVVS